MLSSNFWWTILDALDGHVNPSHFFSSISQHLLYIFLDFLGFFHPKQWPQNPWVLFFWERCFSGHQSILVITNTKMLLGARRCVPCDLVKKSSVKHFCASPRFHELVTAGSSWLLCIPTGPFRNFSQLTTVFSNFFLSGRSKPSWGMLFKNYFIEFLTFGKWVISSLRSAVNEDISAGSNFTNTWQSSFKEFLPN